MDDPDQFPFADEAAPLDPPPAETAPLSPPPDFPGIASAGQRLGAGFVDWILLALVCGLIVLILGPRASTLGPAGSLIGLALGTLYLGIGNSELLKGQTLGKRLAKIQAVDAQGQLLELPKSLLRGAILGSIICLPGLLAYVPILGLVASLLGMAGSLLLIYAYLFNHQTRQGPHDLLTHSYVVQRVLTEAPFPPEMDRKHFWIPMGCFGALTLLLLVLFAASLLLSQSSLMSGLIPGTGENSLNELMTLLQEEGGIPRPGVQFSRRFYATDDGSGSFNMLIITAPKPGTCGSFSGCEDEAQALFDLIRENYTDADDFRIIQIVYTNSVSMGWLSFNWSMSYGFQVE